MDSCGSVGVGVGVGGGLAVAVAVVALAVVALGGAVVCAGAVSFFVMGGGGVSIKYRYVI